MLRKSASEPASRTNCWPREVAERSTCPVRRGRCSGMPSPMAGPLCPMLFQVMVLFQVTVLFQVLVLIQASVEYTAERQVPAPWIAFRGAQCLQLEAPRSGLDVGRAAQLLAPTHEACEARRTEGAGA